MKKLFFTLIAIVITTITIESCSNGSVIGSVPANMESVSAQKMLSDLEENPLKAQKDYMGNWFEITGTLGNVDSEGEYFSFNEGILPNVKCNIPPKIRDEIIDILINIKKKDRITVKGKVTDMGELMGYEVTIVDVRKR